METTSTVVISWQNLKLVKGLVEPGASRPAGQLKKHHERKLEWNKNTLYVFVIEITFIIEILVVIEITFLYSLIRLALRTILS